MHPLMVLIHPLLVLIRGIEGGALASTTGAKAWIGGAHRVEYSVTHTPSEGTESVTYYGCISFPISDSCGHIIRYFRT